MALSGEFLKNKRPYTPLETVQWPFEIKEGGLWHFPRPLVDLWKEEGPAVRSEQWLDAFTEIPSEWFVEIPENKKRALGYHHVRLDWRLGKDAIKEAFSTWIDEQAKGRKSARGRTARKIAQDKLNQLAAWRAHRAGMNREQFCEAWQAPRAGKSQEQLCNAGLQSAIPYADASAFRTAWRAAESELCLMIRRQE